MQDAPSFRLVHDSLLERCAALLKLISSGTVRLSYFRRISSAYLLDADTLKAFFSSEASRSGDSGNASDELLKQIYLAWRRREIVDASLAWARWLLSENKGREAGDVIQRARVEVDGVNKQRLEDEWRHIVDDSTKKPEQEAQSESDDDNAMDQD